MVVRKNVTESEIETKIAGGAGDRSHGLHHARFPIPMSQLRSGPPSSLVGLPATAMNIWEKKNRIRLTTRSKPMSILTKDIALNTMPSQKMLFGSRRVVFIVFSKWIIGSVFLSILDSNV